MLKYTICHSIKYWKIIITHSQCFSSSLKDGGSKHFKNKMMFQVWDNDYEIKVGN